MGGTTASARWSNTDGDTRTKTISSAWINLIPAKGRSVNATYNLAKICLHTEMNSIQIIIYFGQQLTGMPKKTALEEDMDLTNLHAAVPPTDQCNFLMMPQKIVVPTMV